MNRYLVTLTGSICFLFIAIAGKAQQSKVLTLETTNLSSAKGVIIVQLFREQDDLPNKPFAQASAKIVNGKAQIMITDIPFGEYAAILFQDENLNGLLDHRMGFPDEPMGFSNNWKLSLFSGMPTFNKLKFSFNASNQKYIITIR